MAMSRNFKFWILTVGILIVAFIITVWVLEAQKKRIRSENVTYIDKLNTYYSKEIRNTTKSQLEVLSKTFVWALRSEILRDNLEQANIYLSYLVKEDRFELIVYADSEGLIELSSQKKIEGEPFDKHFNIDFLKNENVNIVFEDEKYKVSAPVMGLSHKLGTLYYEYSKK
jgi:hypothetical protein